jgi:hypothetical protein
MFSASSAEIASRGGAVGVEVQAALPSLVHLLREAFELLDLGTGDHLASERRAPQRPKELAHVVFALAFQAPTAVSPRREFPHDEKR